MLSFTTKNSENNNNMGYNGVYLWLGGVVLWGGLGGLGESLNRLNDNRALFELMSPI